MDDKQIARAAHEFVAAHKSLDAAKEDLARAMAKEERSRAEIARTHSELCGAVSDDNPVCSVFVGASVVVIEWKSGEKALVRVLDPIGKELVR